MNDFEKIIEFMQINFRRIIGAIFGFIFGILWIKFGFLNTIGILLCTIVFSIIFNLIPKNVSIKKLIIKFLNNGEDF